MANGLLGKGITAANVILTPYTVPTDLKFATVSLHLLNTGNSEASVKVYLTTNSGTPNVGDAIEYEAKLPAKGGLLERGCLLLSPGERVVVMSNTAGVVARVSGLEQPELTTP